LGPFALRKLWHRLADDDVLEVRGLLMIGEPRFAREHLIAEVFSWLGRICFNTAPADTVEAVQRWIRTFRFP